MMSMSSLLAALFVSSEPERNAGDKVVQQLTNDLRGEIAVLFRISDALAMLDMVYFQPQH